jgi:peroxiredoxin
MYKSRAVAVLVLALAVACAPRRPPYQAGPSFSVKDLDGGIVSSSGLKGKVVIVNFWATWCPPCRAEIPDFVDFYNQNKARGVEIVGFSLDAMTGGPATADQLRPFVQKNGMTYPVIVATEKIVRDFDPGDAIPTTFILDKQGRIRHKQVGAVDRDTLEDWFNRLSAEK